jgi:hypothetical protein
MKLLRALVLTLPLTVGCCRQQSATDIKLASLQSQVDSLEKAMHAESSARLDLQTNLEGDLETWQHINEAQAAGILTEEKAQSMKDMLFGKTPLYKNPGGTFSTNQMAQP